MNSPSKLIVGSEEWCALTSLSIPAIKARIDSGARTSSLHAFNIQPFKRNGSPWISFEVHPLQNNRSTIIRTEAEVYDRRVVKSVFRLLFILIRPPFGSRRLFLLRNTFKDNRRFARRIIPGESSARIPIIPA